MKSRTVTYFLVALPLWLTVADAADAARLLQFTVKVDGQTVLTAIGQDDGYADAATIWSYLRDKKLHTTSAGKLTVKADHPLQCLLKGDIVVLATHGESIIAQSKVAELKLVRTDAASTEWSLPPEEVERTAQAAGLPAIPGAGSGTVIDPMLVVFVCLTGVPLILGIWVFARRQPSTEIWTSSDSRLRHQS